MGEKFKLHFLSDNFGTVEIDEPINFNSLSFDVNQKEKGYGRDIFFNDGEASMEFTYMRNHYLDKLIYYFHYFGFEAKVQLEIIFTNGESVLMDLDFQSAETDDLEYFNCKCIEVSEVQIVKRRSSVKVDLFSDKDIDGNPITPISAQNILLQPKVIKASSEWSQVPGIFNMVVNSGGTATNYDYINPCANIIKSDLEDTLSWFEIQASQPDNFFIHQAANNENNLTVNLSFDINSIAPYSNGGDGYTDMKLYFKYGKDLQTATSQVLLTAFVQEFEVFSSVGNAFTLNIPSLDRNDKVWIYFEFKNRKSSVAGSLFGVIADIKNMKTTISGSFKSYFSTTKGIRLIDAVKQVVKSISGKDVTSPILDQGSLYYDTMLFNGNLLRNIVDKPFYLSLDDLEKSLSTEINGDFETGETVFFGREKDFYTSDEIFFFDNTQFSEFSKKVNDRFAINEFSFMYKNYQSQKENEEANSYDIIHGESKMTLFNKMVENKKDVSIEWARDAFLIEEARNKALEITENTATQDSDTVFAIDTILNETKEFTETTTLFHDYDFTLNTLTLRSTGSPNFKTLGISVGQSFEIVAPDNNAGTYNIVSILENSIDLSPVSATPNDNNDGARSTTYKYIIDTETYPFKNRTDEEITNVANLNGADSYSNIRFSVRRNIENNYSEYLSTCNLYWKDKPLKTTWYKNNRDCAFTYNNTDTVEGSDYTPTNQILSTWIYENTIFANVDFEDFVLIRNELKSKRGFIRTIDKNNNVIKLYPKKMSYEILSKELNILGEAKFEPSQMTINNPGGIITINNETTLVKLNYTIENDKLFVYDLNRQLLYSGVFWDKVSINGGYAKSISELDDLMKLL